MWLPTHQSHKGETMKKYVKGSRVHLAATMLLLANSAFSSNTQVDNIPIGWSKSGTNAEEFVVQLDREASYSGNNSTAIRSIDKDAQGNGQLTVFQFSSAADYRGKRLKVSIYLKGNIHKGQFGVWFQTFDDKQNTLERVFTSFTETDTVSTWTESSVVIDINKNVENILYGIYVDGRGEYWMDYVTIDTVSNDTPLSGTIKEEQGQ